MAAVDDRNVQGNSSTSPFYEENLNGSREPAGRLGIDVSSLLLSYWTTCLQVWKISMAVMIHIPCRIKLK